jgi:hypothetical protein
VTETLNFCRTNFIPIFHELGIKHVTVFLKSFSLYNITQKDEFLRANPAVPKLTFCRRCDHRANHVVSIVVIIIIIIIVIVRIVIIISQVSVM